MKSTKINIHKAVSQELNKRIVRIEKSLKDYKEGLLSESNSSAGDKHNTSRAMMHLEEEKLRNQLLQFSKINKVLHGINSTVEHDKITLGSLVNTDKGWLYIAIPLGKVDDGEIDVMVISLASPIGQALQGKSVHDTFKLNNICWEVKKVL
jgi:transcription elongation GreA/GreB family factor